MLNQRSLPQLDLADGRQVKIMTPEKAMEALILAGAPLATMDSGIDRKYDKIFRELRELNCISKGAAIDKSLREIIAVKIEKSPDTLRIYLNHLERSGYLSSEGGDGGKKTHYLLYDLSEIECRMSTVHSKLSNPGLLVSQMWEEEISFVERILRNGELSGSRQQGIDPNILLDECIVPPLSTLIEVSPELRTSLNTLLSTLRDMREAQLRQIESNPDANMRVEGGDLGVQIPTTLNDPEGMSLFEMMRRVVSVVAEECRYRELVDEEGIRRGMGIDGETLSRVLDVMRRDSGCPVFSPYPGKWRVK